MLEEQSDGFSKYDLLRINDPYENLSINSEYSDHVINEMFIQ